MRILKFISLIAILILSIEAWGKSSEDELKEAIDYMIEGNEEKSYEILNSMIARGDTKAKIAYAQIKTRKGEMDEAIKILEPLAATGDSEAEFYLGQAYFVKSDFKQGNLWLNKSAKHGYYKAIDILNSNAEEPEVVDGNIKIDDLAKISLGVLSKKIARFPEETLVCYKSSRENLEKNYQEAILTCVEKFKAEVGEVYPATETVTASQLLSQCANEIAFERAGVTASSLASCLRTQ
jgi:TPR repeat protein